MVVVIKSYIISLFILIGLVVVVRKMFIVINFYFGVSFFIVNKY